MTTRTIDDMLRDLRTAYAKAEAAALAIKDGSGNRPDLVEAFADAVKDAHAVETEIKNL